MNNKSDKTDKKNFKRNNQNRNNLSRKLNLVLIWLVVVMIIVGGILVAPFTFSRSDKNVTILIPRDATIENVKDTLYKYFGQNYANRVLYLAKVRNIDPSKRNGAYYIPSGTSPLNTMRKLTSGGQTPVKLTINHFRNIDDICEAIAAKSEYTAVDFKKALTDSTLLKNYNLTADQAIALVLEDSYEIYWNSKPSDVAEKIAENYHELWTPKNVQSASDMNLSPSDIMTIASIVDEESNKNREKGRIGQLYINRLRKGMRLQADPTVRYAVGNFSIQRITKDHLQAESPYNTYRVNGLPPGPIRTSSKKTVEAILKAPTTTDLYMCAREDFSGYHNFAETYDQHMVNALKYQQELDRRNIK